jgi:hypothetical protein
VVVLERRPACERVGPLRVDLSRELPDLVGVDAAELGRPLRGVVLEVRAEQGEDGGHDDLLPPLRRHGEGPLERGNDVARGERVARGGDDLLGGFVVPEELLLAAAVLEIVGPEVPQVVHADEERKVGLLPDEGRVVDPLVDDHLRHRQRPRRVGPRPDRMVAVGVLRGGAAVGSEDHDLRPVVAGLGDVVIGGGHRVDRVALEDQEELRVEPVVEARADVELAERQVDAGAEVVDLGVHVGVDAAEHVEQAREPDDPPRSRLGAREVHDRLRARLLDGVEHGVGDVGDRIVPADLLPAPLAPLPDAAEGMEDAVLPVERLAPAGTLLAAHRVGVGNATLDDPDVPGRLLAHHLPVPDVDAHGAVAGIAVHAVRSAVDGIPAPLVPIALLGRDVLRGGARLLVGLDHVRAHDLAPLDQSHWIPAGSPS